MKTVIHHSKPQILPEDIRAVTVVLESGMIAGGEKVLEFESGLSGYIGREYASAVSNGTSALYLALSALGVGSGDEVIIPAYVCSSLLYAVRMTGATPVIADSGADRFHMDADTVKAVMTSETKAILFPHMFGAAIDITDIISLGPLVIEDCSLSLGSELNGVKSGNLGSCASVFSFFATKVIATGEGGMVLSGDKQLIDRVRGPSHYDGLTDDNMHFNFKMTDMAAALGVSQLSRLDTMIERRRRIASKYTEAFAATPLALPKEHRGERHIFYRYALGTDNVEMVRTSLRKVNVMAERPVNMPLSRYSGVRSECPKAEDAWQTTLSIPLYPALSDDDVERVIEAVMKSVK